MEHIVCLLLETPTLYSYVETDVPEQVQAYLAQGYKIVEGIDAD